jgi:hypothetical protein
MVRREVASSVGGFTDLAHPFQGQYDDQIFYVKVGLEVPVFAAGECWSKYRRHPDSTTYIAVQTNQHLFAHLLFLNWMAEYLGKRGISDVEIWRLLREEQLIAKVRAHVQKREWKRAIRDLLVLLYNPRVFVRTWQKLRLRAKLRGWL